MFEFRQNSPQFSPGLLSFVLEYIVANRWPTNGLMGDYNACNTECDVDQTQPCGCTCTTDPFEWTDEEVGLLLTVPLTGLLTVPLTVLSLLLNVEIVRVKVDEFLRVDGHRAQDG